ncbi:MAG: 16S rRNA (adenine(1518)-N(6)/adenine(1519)-N(6))-dimethyltransferase RsmA [Peptoniphilaceae bacterium]|nr:16S rRNA (adenine(1518)-N(6)/adenine(1519)-N(6))-dimethyltransferase RsmA [Peptoniphilaceae bacterium]MDY3987464.1 16S rRNA (adenine(1518)-N(6)/adenine(1519)-N(6))-dimethyltransferase RsmA [Peptoniphilaceae bacterium]
MRQGERLYSPVQLRSVMETAGVQFKKALGQNFLIDGNRVRQIVDAAGVVPGDIALEIGPGVGTLTEELLLRGIQVIAVEIDRTLIPVLHELFAAEERKGMFRLIEGDAMKLPLEEILKKEAPEKRVHVVANLPYYITTPLIERMLTESLPVASMTVMVQKEVAERMTAVPSTSEYGSLTLLMQEYGRTEYCFTVPSSCFMPKPKVDSAVVHLVVEPAASPEIIKRVNRVIRRAFQQRRKTVIKAIAAEIGESREFLEKAFRQAGISPQARAETLSLRDFMIILEKAGYIDQL